MLRPLRGEHVSHTQVRQAAFGRCARPSERPMPYVNPRKRKDDVFRSHVSRHVFRRLPSPPSISCLFKIYFMIFSLLGTGTVDCGDSQTSGQSDWSVFSKEPAILV
jgi:hypothetical protein